MIHPTPEGVVPGPRPYKSRKNRPCDFCRARKAACKIAVAPPCILCQSYGRQCTFLSSPQKRKRPLQEVEDQQQCERRGKQKQPEGRESQHADCEQDIHDNKADQQIASPQSLSSSSPQSSGEGHPTVGVNGHEYVVDVANNQLGSPQARQRRGPGASASPLRSNPTNGKDRLPNAASPDRDSKRLSFSGKLTTWVGDSSEADPYLCRRYHYDENDECVLSKIVYRRIPLDGTNPQLTRPRDGFTEPPVLFMLPEDSLNDDGEARQDRTILDEAGQELMNMIPEEIGLRLVGLFFRFVYPYFPVLSRTQTLSSGDLPSVLRSLPLSLRTAIYVTSLPFLLYDDILATTISHSPPSRSRLYRITWLAITHEIRTPRIATLQACLLLLQRAPTNRYVMDTPFQWSLAGWTVSLAYVLGLCKSCSGWSSMPRWERRLRGRLWWATFVMDKWTFLGAGMPSHIKDDDYDVPLPSLHAGSSSSTSSSTDPEDPLGLLQVPAHFYHLVHLTTIVSDIVNSYYTIRATARTANSFSLSLELARPLRIRLRKWKESFTYPTVSDISQQDENSEPHRSINESRENLDGNASLSLAYIIAAMTLYRALLRAIENQTSSSWDDATEAGRMAVLAGAKECSKEVVEFVEELSRGDPGVWDAFWHSCTSPTAHRRVLSILQAKLN
jgi:hypothetical protein